MVYCCVPMCKSNNRKKLPNGKKLSFHEFPSDIWLRELWIRAISRKDPGKSSLWSPTNDYSAVCSLHFAPSQYLIHTKVPRLIPGAIPSIFPGYPDYLLHNTSGIKRLSSLPTTRNNKGIKKLSLNKVEDFRQNCDVLYTSNKNMVTKRGQNPEILDCAQNFYDTNNDVENVHKLTKPCINSDFSSDVATNLSNVIKSSFAQNINNLLSKDNLVKNSKIPASEIACTISSSTENVNILSAESNPSLCVNNNTTKENYRLVSPVQRNSHRTVSVQTIDRENYKVCKTKLESANRKIRRCKAQILKLKEENKKLQFMNAIMNEKFRQFNIEELEKGIASKDTRALLLNDQLHSLTKERILWSENSVEFTYTFKKKFPLAYSFLMETNIINLPCLKIVKSGDHVKRNGHSNF